MKGTVVSDLQTKITFTCSKLTANGMGGFAALSRESLPESYETCRVPMSDGRSLAGASLAVENRASAAGASRLKAGCSQDWLPHKEL